MDKFDKFDGAIDGCLPFGWRILAQVPSGQAPELRAQQVGRHRQERSQCAKLFAFERRGEAPDFGCVEFGELARILS